MSTEAIEETISNVVYDSFDPNSLQGWHLNLDQGYQELTRNHQAGSGVNG